MFPSPVPIAAKTQTTSFGAVGSVGSPPQLRRHIAHDGSTTATAAAAEHVSDLSAVVGHSLAANGTASATAVTRTGRGPLFTALSVPLQSSVEYEPSTEHNRVDRTILPTDHLLANNDLITKCPPYRNSVISQLVLLNKSSASSTTRIYQKNVAGNGHSVTNSCGVGARKNKSMVSSSGATSSKKCRNMVAMQEIISSSEKNRAGYTGIDDSSEELQYGPGIVSKLRYRFLSLTLRQAVSKQRPSLDNLRRATSLNNLLDGDDEEVDGDGESDDDDDNEYTVDDDSSRHSRKYLQLNGYSGGGGAYIASQTRSRATSGTGEHRLISECEYQQQKSMDNRRPIGRGNDSLKRARSVEALVRYDNRAWRRDIIKDSDEYSSHNPIILDELIVSDHHPPLHATGHLITVEDKIHSSRQRRDFTRPKRLTSFMDDTERPPPDLVKQTLLKFEATCNRKPPTRYPNGDVANKVATYTGIMAHEKKPPLTGTTAMLAIKKPMTKPRTTSPKPANVRDDHHRATVKIGSVSNEPSLDVNTIRQNFRSATKGVFHGTVTAPAPLSAIRVDTTNAYRQVARTDSPLSPNMMSPKLMTSPRSPLSPSRMPPNHHVHNMNKSPKVVSEADSVIISQLAKKVDSMQIAPARLVAANTVPLMSPKPNYVAYDSDGEEHPTSSDAESTDGSSTFSIARDGHRVVSKLALENISKAGTTTKYQFEAKTTNNNTTVSVNGSARSHLPNGMTTFAKRNSTTAVNSDSVTAHEPNVRQVGIIRPLVAEVRSTTTSVSPTNPYHNYTNVNAAAKSNDTVVEAKLPATTVTAVATRPMASDDITKTDNNFPMSDSMVTTVTIQTNPQSLSLREIQRNQINREKSDGADETQSLAVLPPKRTAIKRAQVAANGQPTGQQPNSMVFNFKHRKDVPDYIENDGLIIRRKREMPKVSVDFFFFLSSLFD